MWQKKKPLRDSLYVGKMEAAQHIFEFFFPLFILLQMFGAPKKCYFLNGKRRIKKSIRITSYNGM